MTKKKYIKLKKIGKKARAFGKEVAVSVKMVSKKPPKTTLIRKVERGVRKSQKKIRNFHNRASRSPITRTALRFGEEVGKL